MKRVSGIIAAVVAIAIMGCASSNQTARKSVFTFNYENQTYEIISVNTPSGEGTNILSLVGSDETISARDMNQDGFLDVVIRGDLELDDLNEIYATGINIARMSGNYQEREALRKFEWKNESYTLTISTYLYSENEINNQFTILFTDNGKEAMFTDRMGDGTLDSVEKGLVELQRAQQLYEMTLLKGIDEGRIEKKEFCYQVLPKYPVSKSAESAALSSLQ